MAKCVALNVGILLLKVQKKPQLEGWTRQRHINAVVSRLDDGITKMGVFVAVKQAPHIVEPQGRVALPACSTSCFIPHGYCALDDRSGDTRTWF
jgi:hypothetical protein